MTVIELKGRTDREKGEHYLQLSSAALKELADLLEDERLSATDKAAYDRAFTAGQDRYEQTKMIRDRLLAQKKSFRKFLINIFARESEAKHFYRVSRRNYAAIRTTSDELHRLLVPDKNDFLGSPGESAQGNVSVNQENPRDVVEGNLSVDDLSPNETIRGINLDVPTEQVQEVLVALNRLGIAISEKEEDEDVDDDRTVRPSTSESRPPSPTPSCTIIYNHYYINQSVVSFDSEMTGTTFNSGVNGGVGSASPYPWD